MKVLFVHEQVLTVGFSFKDAEVFWISVVYASCDHVVRRLL